MINKKINYILFGIILIIIALVSSNYIYANALDNLEVNFEKEYYSIMEDQSLVIEFSYFNNSDKDLELEIFAVCEDDEIDCDYYNKVNISKNTSRTASFYVNGREDGDSEVKLSFRDENGLEEIFYIDVEVFDDLDDGEFAIDVDNKTLCVGRENSLDIEIDNDYKADLYYLAFKESILNFYLDQDSPVYLPKDEKTIRFYVNVPSSIDTTRNEDFELIIENEQISVIKEISLSFDDCQANETEFAVSGSSYQSVNLEKGVPKTISYNIINQSNLNKIIYVSEHSNLDIDVNISNRAVNISPNNSKEVDITIIANKNIDSGNYTLDLEFFDGLSSVKKEVNLIVEAEYSLDSKLLQVGTIPLDMESSKSLELLFVNNGDISEDFQIDLVTTGNPINVDLSKDHLRLNPNSTQVVIINLSANENTNEDSRTYMQISIEGLNSNYKNVINREILSFRDKPSVSLDFLSIPQTLSIDKNSTIDFEIEVFNFYDEDLYLEKIEIRGLPQQISYELPTNILIKAKESKVIRGTLISQDLEDQVVEAEFAFISQDGGIITKDLTINIGDVPLEEQAEESEEQETKKGFFSGLSIFGSSFGFGLILVCFLIILLFFTRVIKKAPLRARN
jgi:hypothetical protein